MASKYQKRVHLYIRTYTRLRNNMEYSREKIDIPGIEENLVGKKDESLAPKSQGKEKEKEKLQLKQGPRGTLDTLVEKVSWYYQCRPKEASKTESAETYTEFFK